MGPELAYILEQMVLASTLAVVLVGVLRKPLRYVVGARAAYWVWLLVPASAVIIVLPVRPLLFREPTALLSSPVRAAVTGTLHTMQHATASTNWATSALLIWAIGALVAFAIMSHRHRAFVRSLGAMTSQPDGSLRATHCVDPVLLGVLRPRVVLPTDFDSRYDKNQQAMVLAHELAHLGRRDAQVNAAAASWLCLSWFNPLMYWAENLFRFDQELACDAAVLAAPGASPRSYADALFKTQMATDVEKRRLVLGCHWHSTHPLKERISMLKRPIPRGFRMHFGLAVTLGLTALGCYAVKAAQSEVPIPQPEGQLIALNVRWLLNDAPVPIMADHVPHDTLLHSGGILHMGFNTPDTGNNEFECTVDSSSGTASSAGDDNPGEFLISCKLLNNGKVFATPTVVARDGQTAIIKSETPAGVVTSLEFNPSSSAARVSAARESMAQVPPNGWQKTFVLKQVSPQQPATPADPASR